MNNNALAAIQSTAVNQLIQQSANLRKAQNSSTGSDQQSDAICDTLETGDPESGGRQIPQPTKSPAVNPDAGHQDDSIESGSILDIDG